MPIPGYLKEVPGGDGYSLAAPEFVNFVKESSGWKVDIRRREILNAARDFLSWYIGYADEIVKGKHYKMEGVVTGIFRLDFKKKDHWIEFVLKSIYVSRQYVEHILKILANRNIHRYQHTLVGLRIDLEELILQYEVDIRKSITNGKRNSIRRMDLSTMDLWFAARAMFWIEERDGVEELYLRDVKPVVIFQIRQLIEVYGRKLLGYFEIRNSNGTVNKKVTHEAWKFITEEVKRENSRILLPFNVDMINHVNDWANSFVHSTYLYSSYIQYYALEVVALLFDFHPVAGREILATSGWNPGVAGVQLKEYNALKTHFETYVRKKVKDEVLVEWMDHKSVGAHIVSF